ncbi:MAG: CRISPR-associated endonuclease Cas2, partial [Bacteroidia bacterium]|nr:CRISPR-associated endonuclease Cas2 [Bacteroidia bacterium]
VILTPDEIQLILNKKGLRKRILMPDGVDLLPLNDRIKKILQIIKDKPVKSYEMICFIMYDIESNKVRNEVAKFLIRKGAIRIQKSVYLIRENTENIMKIYNSLKQIQECYENNDSIIISPVEVSSLRSMKLIGKQIDLKVIIDKPNTLFF